MKFKDSVSKIESLEYEVKEDISHINKYKTSKLKKDTLTCSNCVFYSEVNQFCGHLYTYNYSDDYCKNHKIMIKNFKRY